MLTREIMGLFALAILWVNTLLVVAATLGQLRGLLRWLGTLRALRSAAVKAAPHGELARFSVEQVGRRAADDDDRPAILFHDRSRRGEVLGGELEIAGERVTLAPGGEVWVDPEALKRAAACPSATLFDTAHAAARKAKGHVRTVTVAVQTGDVIHVVVAPGRPTLVATFDPRPLLRRKAALLAGFSLAMAGASAGITLLCLVPPVFGFWSTVGGVLGLVHFLLVLQPLGVTVRDKARLPSDTELRGSWFRPGSETLRGSAGAVALHADSSR